LKKEQEEKEHKKKEKAGLVSVIPAANFSLGDSS